MFLTSGDKSGTFPSPFMRYFSCCKRVYTSASIGSKVTSKMNPLTNVKNTLKLNEKMLEMGVEDSESWHKQYKDSAYIFIGGLPYDLTEGDILCVFSQYGEIVNINLVRDKKTGKTKGFCFLCYEDQRSTVLAVDNFNGIKLGGRTIRVDHCSNYRRPLSDEKDEHGNRKEIVEVGCAPKTPSPSPPQSEEDEEVADLPKKRKKEKKAKKQKKHKEEKSKKKQETSGSSEEEGGEKKRRLDLVDKGTSRSEPGKAQPMERERRREYDQKVSYEREKYDSQGKTLRERGHDGDNNRDYKRQEGMEYNSKDDQSHKRGHRHDFYDKDTIEAGNSTRKDNRNQHAVDEHRVERDRGASRTSHHGNRDNDFIERRDRSDKRDYRAADRDRARDRSDRYSDHRGRKDRR